MANKWNLTIDCAHPAALARRAGRGAPGYGFAPPPRLQAIARTLPDSLDCDCRAWEQCPAIVS